MRKLLAAMLLATLPCGSLVLEELVNEARAPEPVSKTELSPAASLLRPLLFEFSIMPAGQGRILKDARSVFRVGERMNWNGKRLQQ